MWWWNKGDDGDDDDGLHWSGGLYEEASPLGGSLLLDVHSIMLQCVQYDDGVLLIKMMITIVNMIINIAAPSCCNMMTRMFVSRWRLWWENSLTTIMMNDDAALCSLPSILLRCTIRRWDRVLWLSICHRSVWWFILDSCLMMTRFVIKIYDGSYRIPWKSKQPVWQLKQIWQLQKTGMFDCLGPR